MYDTKQYTTSFLNPVKEIIISIPESDRSKITAAIVLMEEGNFHLVETKILQSPIRELKIKKYRLVFFIHEQILYFIHIFVKKTAKTPKKEIKYSQKIYKMIIENYK